MATDQLYMLDTNMVSYIIRGHSRELKQKLIEVPIGQLCISCITEAEIRHGLARKPDAKDLHQLVREFLIRVECLAWTSEAALAYADLRLYSEKNGKSLSAMDLLIAAHALATHATLITNDQAFYKFQNLLKLDDWTKS